MKNLSSKEKAMLYVLVLFANNSLEFKDFVNSCNAVLESITTNEKEFIKDLKKACKKYEFKFEIIESDFIL
jgi:hypothetical protein